MPDRARKTGGREPKQRPAHTRPTAAARLGRAFEKWVKRQSRQRGASAWQALKLQATLAVRHLCAIRPRPEIRHRRHRSSNREFAIRVPFWENKDCNLEGDNLPGQENLLNGFCHTCGRLATIQPVGVAAGLVSREPPLIRAGCRCFFGGAALRGLLVAHRTDALDDRLNRRTIRLGMRVERLAHGGKVLGTRCRSSRRRSLRRHRRRAGHSRPSVRACRNNGSRCRGIRGMPQLPLTMTVASGRASVMSSSGDEDVGGADAAIGADAERRPATARRRRRGCPSAAGPSWCGRRCRSEPV